MKKHTIFKILTPVLLLVTEVYPSRAQNLPRIQQNSLRVPLNTKIDGKATEWGEKFEAYNNSTEIFYTISNDDDKLYIILRAKIPEIIKKIITGAVSFTFSTTDKKLKNPMTISYPAYNKDYPPLRISMDKIIAIEADSLKTKMRKDSIMNKQNNKLRLGLKLIGVNGTKLLKDSIISIYNEDGFRVMALFNDQQWLTYELAFPLKHLGFNSDKMSIIYYNIKLNGIYGDQSNLKTVETSRGKILVSTGPDGRTMNLGPASSQDMNLAYPTEFSGEYHLAN